MKLRRCRILTSLFICFLLVQCLLGQTWTKQLAKGVTLTQQVMNSSKPLVVNVLTIDPKIPGVRLKAVIARDKVIDDDDTKGRETVSSMAKRLNAAVAVNADFFPFTGDMLSLHVTDGEIVSEPWQGRVVFGITADGRPLFDKVGFVGKVMLPDGRSFEVRGVNRSRGKNEIVLYTPRYSRSTGTSKDGVEVVVKLDNGPVRIGSPVTGVVSEILTNSGNTRLSEGCIVLSGAGMASIPLSKWLSVGTSVTLDLKLNGVSTTGWDNVVEAVGGGPCLLKNGEEFIDAEEEGFSPSFSTTSHPRTALGATADGKIVIVTVDGRQSVSSGMSLDRLAELMKSLSCVNAINLDGGGSTTIATYFGVLNSPSDGSERPVANGLAVLADPLDISDTVPDFVIVPTCDLVQVGSVAPLALVDPQGQPLKDELCNQAVWTSLGGAGFVDQSGRFFGLREKKGSVAVRIGQKTATLPINVVAASVYKISATLDNDPSGDTNRSILAVTIKDQYGKAGAGRKVDISVIGGSSDCPSLQTSSDGTASAIITWDPSCPGTPQVTISSEGLSPITITRPIPGDKPEPDTSNQAPASVDSH